MQLDQTQARVSTLIEALAKARALQNAARSSTNLDDDNAVDSSVTARLKPASPLNSGAIALPLPEETPDETSALSPLSLHLAAY